jgi:hypothetical protein
MPLFPGWRESRSDLGCWTKRDGNHAAASQAQGAAAVRLCAARYKVGASLRSDVGSDRTFYCSDSYCSTKGSQGG